ncbi:HAD-IIB family hydrolase [Thiovibrio sp. JS02]
MYLLCSDLDRTILPNGPAPESPQARPLLRALVGRPEVRLAYVSGRHRELLLAAIREYRLPVPDFAIGDVGTTIYTIGDRGWQPLEAWQAVLSRDWHGESSRDLAGLFADRRELTLQEPEKQGRFKLSFYTPPEINRDALFSLLRERLHREGLAATLIWSVDESAHLGLLDILPARADKLTAIRFLMEQEGIGAPHTVFAGDSGNDLAVLTSGLNAVLVKNADSAVRREAEQLLAEKNQADRLYCAKGDFLGMNGNYAAGVSEGLCHFFPELAPLAWEAKNRLSL